MVAAIRRGVLIAFTLTAWLGAACAPAASEQQTSRLIIHLQDAKADPSSAAWQRELAVTARAEIVYLRPLGDGAHLFRVSHRDALEVVMQRLKARPDIHAVEPDRRLRHQ